jgi:hypothetical protein
MTRFLFTNGKCFLAGPLLVTGLFLVLVQTPEAQQRGGSVRVKGEVVSFDGQMLTVKTESGQTTEVTVPASARISSLTRASFADIKKGDFIASAGIRQKDGTLRAVELRIFPEEMRGRGEGHRPFRGGPDSTMTNATVDLIVGSIDNRTLKVEYPGGEKTIVVPEDTPVMRQEVGDKSLLTSGAPVSVTARKDPNGRITATRISVGKGGLVPPL